MIFIIMAKEKKIDSNQNPFIFGFGVVVVIASANSADESQQSRSVVRWDSKLLNFFDSAKAFGGRVGHAQLIITSASCC